MRPCVRFVHVKFADEIRHIQRTKPNNEAAKGTCNTWVSEILDTIGSCLTSLSNSSPLPTSSIAFSSAKALRHVAVLLQRPGQLPVRHGR